MKKVVSGITATGDLTLGNYLGAIKYLVEAQDHYDLYMFLADLHGLTVPIEPDVIRSNIKKQLKTYLACGIDVNKTKLFRQSDINGHTEFFYYLSTISNEGQLKRMTQYKDKSIKNANNTEQVPLGIMLYPILMVGDILLYNADGVMVGEDQKQHIELTRDLAERLNKKYKTDFNIPEPIIAKEGARIMALRTPTKKMSKSDSNLNETIFLLDDPEIARKKIMTALTDSENKVYYDVENKPGVSNLLTIYASIKNIKISEAENELKNLEYKEFKEEIANLVVELLTNIQSKYNNLTDNDVQKALESNKKEIQNVANNTIKKVRKAFGME